MDKLLLIDGNAILHRAYHAYPAFTDDNGNYTNAIYGFFAMLIKLIEEISPHYISICWDKGSPTFRMNLYIGYHANRPKMPDDLSLQLPRLEESLESLGIPMYGIDGYEADDLIGTLSVFGKRKNLETIIVTGDRDLLQLVNVQVKVLMPLTGITKTILFDAKAVEEKFGVKPTQFIDYKALVGDASDNYPGVTGIGPKGAANLLQKYGSFENLYKNLDKLPVGIKVKLATDAEQAALAKKLATIETGVPIHLDLKKAKITNFPKQKFAAEFEKFGFDSLKKRVLKDDSKASIVDGNLKKEKKEVNQLELL